MTALTPRQHELLQLLANGEMISWERDYSAAAAEEEGTLYRTGIAFPIDSEEYYALDRLIGTINTRSIFLPSGLGSLVYYELTLTPKGWAVIRPEMQGHQL